MICLKKSKGAYVGKFDLPGESIEHGEKPIETLKRELKGEINCEISSSKLIDANSVVIVFNHDIKDDSDELDSSGAEWYDISKLTKNNLSVIVILELEKLRYVLN